MLQNFKIKNFKSIYSAELKFGRSNLFIGPNGAGKSNVLEALGVLACALSRGLEPLGLDDRGIRLSVPTMFKSSFKSLELPKTFTLSAQFEHGSYKCSIRAGLSRHTLEFHSEELIDGTRKIFGRGPNGVTVDNDRELSRLLGLRNVEPTRSVWDVISSLVNISDEFRDELQQFTQYAIYAPQTAIMRGIAVDSRVKEPLGLTGTGLATAFGETVFNRDWQGDEKERVDKIMFTTTAPGWMDMIQTGQFDSNIVPSHVKSDGILLYLRDKYMKTTRNRLSAFDASEGTLYLIFVATLLAHPSAPKVFALDNVDGTLNSGLVRKLTSLLVDVCCSKGDFAKYDDEEYQAFVTSHHPSSLDSFDIFAADQSIFVTYRNEERHLARGSTAFDRISPPEGVSKDEWAERSGGRNLSELLLDKLIPKAIG